MASTPKALLVVTNDLVSNPNEIARLKQELAEFEVHQQLLERLTEHAVNLTANKFSKIHITGGSLSSDVANCLYDALIDGGVLDGRVSTDSGAPLVIAGFVESPQGWTKHNRGASAALPIRSSKPTTGSSAPRKPRAFAAFKRAPVISPAASDEDEDGLIDEDDLVSGESVTPAFNFPAKCNPGPGKKRRRACKDCTCGLKELEDSEQQEVKEKQSAVLLNHDEIAEIDFTVPGKAVGGCGSCALGDAFRCDGCPYLGLPPFKPGEIVSVDQFGDDF